MKNGDLFLENSLINIDGDSEIGDKSLKCHTIFLKGKMNIFSLRSHSFYPRTQIVMSTSGTFLLNPELR